MPALLLHSLAHCPMHSATVCATLVLPHALLHAPDPVLSPHCCSCPRTGFSQQVHVSSEHMRKRCDVLTVDAKLRWGTGPGFPMHCSM